MILATLFLFDKEQQIFSFFSASNPEICDQILPLRFNSSDDYEYGLSPEERQLFTYFQWHVYTPVLTGIISGNEDDVVAFHEETSLPWKGKERIGEQSLGERSFVERIEIYSHNHDLVSLTVNTAM